MKKLMKLTVIAATLVQSSAFAAVIRDKAIVKTFKNTNCEANNTCDLKEFSITTNDYHVIFQDGSVSHGSNAFMSYKTKEVDQLENYAIVQQIRGCQFRSTLMGDGSVNKEIQDSREFFDSIIKFKHVDWVIDSVDLDPVYNSNPNLRHASYRWNTKPGSFDKNTEKVYYNERPTTPSLYVSDLPGTAFYSEDGEAKNLSMEFVTCIYKTSDIPLIAAPADINFSAPIACHTWKSSFIYNHQKDKFEVKDEVDSFCLEKPAIEITPEVPTSDVEPIADIIPETPGLDGALFDEPQMIPFTPLAK